MAMSNILNADDIKKALDAFKGKALFSFLITFCQTHSHNRFIFAPDYGLQGRITHNSDD